MIKYFFLKNYLLCLINFKCMKKIFYLLVVFISVLVSCSKDDSDSTSDSFTNLVVNTKTPIFNSSTNSYSAGGNLSVALQNNNFEYEFGVCYSESPNPNVTNSNTISGYLNNTNFDCTINDLQLGVTYYIKAYVRKTETNEIKYGNEVVFVQPLNLTTNIVKNISLTGFSVTVNVGSDLSNNSERGVCYSTSPNPTISNSRLYDSTTGSGDYTISVDGTLGVSPFYYVSVNTTYYLRSYIYLNGIYYYGNQVTFKSCGYVGGSGGYVFYDKGEITNGWRYLEASTTKLNDPNSTNFKWSNTSTFMSGISQEIGAGLDNSTLIRNSNNFTNIAATMCVFNSNNNVNDWFLPSSKELKELYKLKIAGLVFNPASGPNSFYNKNVLSSSQRDATTCYGINFDNGNEVILGKTEQLYSGWQVRRF